MYMTIAHASQSKNEECLRWIQQVENVADHEELSRAEPFAAADGQLAKALQNKMYGLTQQKFLSLSKKYLTEGRMMKGRQMLWLVFQNYQVDKVCIDIFKWTVTFTAFVMC